MRSAMIGVKAGEAARGPSPDGAAMGEYLHWEFCRYTRRLLLWLLSLGRLKVADLPGSWWNPFSRSPDGTLAVSQDAAMLFGSLFWVIVIATGLIALVRG